MTFFNFCMTYGLIFAPQAALYVINGNWDKWGVPLTCFGVATMLFVSSQRRERNNPLTHFKQRQAEHYLWREHKRKGGIK